jgi:hypothetical protein
MLMIRPHTIKHTHETPGVYANLDTITITFDKDTDKAGLAEGVVQTRAVVDALFAFSQSLGDLVCLSLSAPHCSICYTFFVSILNLFELPGRC